MSIKDIIAKAKENDQEPKLTSNQDSKTTSNQDSKLTSNQDSKLTSNQDSKTTSNQDSKTTSNQDSKTTSNQDSKTTSSKKNKQQKDLARKVMNLDVPAVVKNYWMGQIKSEGESFRRIVISMLIKKYGLPENWKKDEL